MTVEVRPGYSEYLSACTETQSGEIIKSPWGITSTAYTSVRYTLFTPKLAKTLLYTDWECDPPFWDALSCPSRSATHSAVLFPLGQWRLYPTMLSKLVWTSRGPRLFFFSFSLRSSSACHLMLYTKGMKSDVEIKPFGFFSWFWSIWHTNQRGYLLTSTFYHHRGVGGKYSLG